jgi:hypothetical protein
VGLPQAIGLGVATSIVAAIAAVAGRQELRKARLVERTPTTPGTSTQGGAVVEVKGRVTPAGQVVERRLAPRDAVWLHLRVEDHDGSSSRVLLDEVQAVAFLVDDGSGRMARVEPDRTQFAVTLETEPGWGSERDRGRVLELLAHRHVEDVVPSRLVWKERGLFVGDPVYVLGPAEAAAGPPQSEGYRAGPSTQLVLRSRPAARLTIAAMTEEAYVARLKKGGRGCLTFAVLVTLVGITLTTLAAATTVLDCDGGSDTE